MTSVRLPDDRVALVLAGAVAKGAFAVGAVAHLAETGCPIHRVAATSSGALTAAVLGAGMATGKLAWAAEVAKDLWLNHGAWNDVAHVSIDDWLHAKGLLDTSNLVAMVKEGIHRVVEGGPRGVVPTVSKVTLITTRLSPRACEGDDLPVYEHPIHFDVADFLDPGRWVDIATAAAASATFPGVFAPTMLGGEAYVDGGAVNNAPISYVLDDPAVRRVLIVTTESTAPEGTLASGGMDLIGKLADILINERVSQDLAAARKTNAILERVRAALQATGASEPTTTRVLDALGWRELDLVLVRPEPALAGTAFSAFFDQGLRRDYIDAGERAAELALAGAP